MARKKVCVLVALLCVVGWAAVAQAERLRADLLIEEFFGASADGSQDTYDGTWDEVGGVWTGGPEGYAIDGDGACRLGKYDQHIPYMGFNYQGDGLDEEPTQHEEAVGEVPPDLDGLFMGDYLATKKIIEAWFYIRSYTNSAGCEPDEVPGTYFQEPADIVLFRVDNAGKLVDRGQDGNGYGSCCGTYKDYPAQLEGGESAPPAWRMGVPNVPYQYVPDPMPDPPVEPVDYMGYSEPGDVGDEYAGLLGPTPAEYYKVSSMDSTYPGEVVDATVNANFDHDGDGFEGFSGPVNGMDTNSQDEMWGFEYIVRHSDALLTNTETLTVDDCSDDAWGVTEPRDAGAFATPSQSYSRAWFGVVLDKKLVKQLANGAKASDPNVNADEKGLIVHALNMTDPGVSNQTYNTRDQNGLWHAPYVAVVVTLGGDVNNDKVVNLVDVLTLAQSWNTSCTVGNYNEEADFNLDCAINLVDVLILAGNWNLSTSDVVPPPVP